MKECRNLTVRDFKGSNVLAWRIPVRAMRFELSIQKVGRRIPYIDSEIEI